MVISGLFTLIGQCPQKSLQLHFYKYFTLTPSMVTKNPRIKKVQYQAYDFYFLFFFSFLCLTGFRKEELLSRGAAVETSICLVLSQILTSLSFPAIFMTTTLIQWGWMMETYNLRSSPKPCVVLQTHFFQFMSFLENSWSPMRQILQANETTHLPISL